MSRTLTHMISVEWDDCDPGGVVRGPVYFRWFEMGTRLLFGSVGMPWDMLIGFQGVVGVPLISVTADFKRPIRFADSIMLQSTIVGWAPRSFDVEHILTGPEDAPDIQRARGTETRCWAVEDTTREGGFRADEIPEEIALLFQ